MQDGLVAQMGDEVLCGQAQDASEIEKVINVATVEGPLGTRFQMPGARAEVRDVTYAPS